MRHFLICILLLISSIHLYGQTPWARKLEPEKSEGDRPYTPTRIEWLLVEYRNECATWLDGIPTLSWSLYSGLKEKNLINIKVQFDDESVRARAKSGAENCERNIRALAKDRGWTWLTAKIELGNRDFSKNAGR